MVYSFNQDVMHVKKVSNGHILRLTHWLVMAPLLINCVYSWSLSFLTDTNWTRKKPNLRYILGLLPVGLDLVGIIRTAQ